LRHRYEMSPHVRRAARAGFFSRFKRNRGPRRSRKGMWQYVGIIISSLVLAGSVSVIGIFAWAAKDLPDPNNITQRNIPQTTKIYDRTGKTVLYEVHGDQKRTNVELADISDYLKKATIAAEDKDFYTHHGFDVRGILRALWNDVRHPGQKLQSGSTITQQFIKKSVLSDDQTVTRKVKEIVLSIEIERVFSKDQILKLYLNEIPYGSVAYGIESASQTFFGKPAKDLTLSEAALLASLPKGPTYYSPFGNHRDKLIERQHYVLDQMVDDGLVSRDDADAAKKDDVLSRVKPNREPIVAPHFVFYIKDLLAQEFGEQTAEQGGLKVITTLDVTKQKIAEDAITANIPTIKKWNANTAAMMAMDPKTGEILAMVGSADYFDDSINGKYNAILGLLQPGSSIKPMVYGAAFEKGYTESTVVEDIKTDFSTTPKPYSPSDYDGKERGFVTLKEALAGSLNIPAVKVLYLTGLDTFQNFAERVGYTTFADKSRFGLSLVLGGAEVRPIEHIAAFSAYAQEGVIHPTKAILRVEDASGKVLKDDTETAPGKKAFDPEIARQVDDILTDNSARSYIFGEKNFLTLDDRPVAAKTGTTNDFKDAWTVGFTPSLVAGVWVGDSNGNDMKKGADGSQVAAPIWNRFMKAALAGTPVETFTPPQAVVTGKPVLDGQKNAQMMVKIDRVSGKLATPDTPPEYVEERGYGVPHSILFFVDKDHPRDPPPDHPETDPQFPKWEQAVSDWATKQGLTANVTQPPTESDDVHVAANKPTVSFLTPADGGTISERTFHPSVAASAPRGVAKVEYAMDDQAIGSAVFAPFDAPVTVPNRFGKGFHTLTATAYDDVGNRNSTTITVNFTAPLGALGVHWNAPWYDQHIGTAQFPYSVKITLDDPKGIKTLRIFYRSTSSGGDSGDIGSIDNPALPGMAMDWQSAPATGNYTLTVQATYDSGDTLEESIPVTVQ
jgi:1A family penicillin-binding protein